MKNATGAPIEIINDDGTQIVVCIAQNIQLVKDGEKYIIKISGMLQYGCIFEEVKYIKDIITNVILNGIGITK